MYVLCLLLLLLQQVNEVQAFLKAAVGAAAKRRLRLQQKADEYRGDSSGSIRFCETTHQYIHGDRHAHRLKAFSQGLLV
jgi:hypothetical protein